MADDFWASRWREGRTNFHEGRPNKFLAREVARLGHRVLVPLCGKAEDLAYLAARGHEVVGIELVEDAARAFFEEHGLAPAVARRGPLTEYRAAGIAILVGDVFAATREAVGAIDTIYDRAALIALPPDVRPTYVAHVRAIAAGAPTLLVTLEYPDGAIQGPPFSVPLDEVHALFGAAEELAAEPAESGRAPEALARCFWIAA